MGAFKKLLIALIVIFALIWAGYFAKDYIFDNDVSYISVDDIPEYSGEPYVVINGGEPFFTKEEIVNKSYENYSPLDELGRCGVAMACLGKDLMPTEEREEIGHIEPSGWKQAQYDCISGGYLYNRCHLIGFQLAGENDNKQNLITGTGYMNVTGMLPFENMIDDYVEETGNHVMYRVTPIYEGKYDLVACGVLMEAYSVEDEGEGICFNVFCYNVQPGVAIDYYDGSSWLDGDNPPPKDDENNSENDADNNDGENNDDDNDEKNDGENSGDVDDGEVTYIVNIKTKKIHLTTCRYNSGDNVKETTKSLEELLAENYTTCGVCKPDKSE